MFTSIERKGALALLAICVVTAVAGYSLTRRDGSPERIWFDAAGGNVVFDHAYHVSLVDDCGKCHHPLEGGGEDRNCRSCHYYGAAAGAKSQDPTHPRFIGANCVECHKGLGESQGQCDTCHIRKGFEFEVSGRTLQAVPEWVVFAEKDFAQADMGPVGFDHKAHLDFAQCGACHHDYDAEAMGVGAGEKSCRACHYALAGKIEASSPDDIHERFIGAECRQCHDQLGDRWSDCSACHAESGQEPTRRPAAAAIPSQVVFDAEPGKASFDHSLHLAKLGGASCAKCHHDFKGPDSMSKRTSEKNCRACHYALSTEIPESDDAMGHVRHIGHNCVACHQEQSEDCAFCHKE